MNFENNSASCTVIGKAMEVHCELVPGINEEFYHRLLSEKLLTAGLEHQFKPRTQMIYRGHVAAEFEPDLVVPSRLIPEQKPSAAPLTWAPALPSGIAVHFGNRSVELRFVKHPTDFLILYSHP